MSGEAVGPLFDPRRSAMRERQRTAVEAEADVLIDALFEDLASTGLQDAEIAERSGTERGHLSRVRAKQAHPPQALIAFAIDHSRHWPPRYLVALNAVADYEPKAKPPPDVSAVFSAYRDEVIAAFPELDAILIQRVERRLGCVLDPRRAAPGEAK
jgi:hypothetical protein